ncbi:DsbE family thiol:disulfide interchange protein [Vibrio campbellii]|uniref:DsbE family thiol:disulfide interchange protein n=1 Tax=Vibrio campbellii TaxID=680 RepID=A0ACC7R5C5_9VIBR|nr:DsbE family thiol:disulfide interchange protein [Vibrio campbellii]ARR44108.1 thiol:disulfide interchange protein [Vibrio campbellii]MCC8252939.1 DsbE family thiol:disulfide interchange protein [Vibrio campbellii CAIM 333]
MRSRNSLKLAGLVAAVSVFSAVTAIGLSERPNVELSQQRNLEIPNFSSESLMSDEMISQQILKSDGYKLLNVWASWCGVCKREHEELLQLSELGVPIVGLNYRDQKQAAREYLSSKRNPYIEVISDPNGKLAVELGVIGTPETYLIDQNGRVLIKYRGELTADKWNDIFSGYLNVSI